MKLYFAGNVTTAEQETELCTKAGIQYRLLSFADIDSWGKDAFGFWTSERAPMPFFLDSGAFGALTRGATIDLKRYCEYIKSHAARLYPYACLDVIGDWRGSAINYDTMLGEGLDPVPTYHMGSPEHEFHRLLRMADYIALGGVVGATRETMQPWLDQCWRILRDYWPKKVHVFGVMAQWALERYPFYSADSSSALVGAGMGRVSVWEQAKVTAIGWQEYGQKYYDGLVMDGVSRVQAKGGSAHRGRSYLNIRTQLTLQRHVTDVWRLRGIDWEDLCAASTVPLAR